MKNTGKIIAVSLSLAIATISLGSSADGASTSVASQISALQKKIVALQSRVSYLENAPAPTYTDVDPVGVKPSDLATTDIFYFGFDTSCKAPADIVTTIPLPSSVVCHIKVLIPASSQ